MPDITISLDAAQNATIEAIAASREQTAAEYLQTQADNQIAKATRENYTNWFRGLSVDAQKAIYDANQ